MSYVIGGGRININKNEKVVVVYGYSQCKLHFKNYKFHFFVFLSIIKFINIK